MDTREQLRRRPDVDPKDLDQIVELASELQEASRRREGRASVAEVEAVAAELDIEPRFVGEAVQALAERRAANAVAEARVASERAAQRSRMQTTAGWLGLGAAAMGLVVALGVGGLAVRARSELASAEAAVVEDERALASVLDRQQNLVPAVVALAGGAALHLPEVPAEAPITERLAASEALGDALTDALRALPPPSSDVDRQGRLNLQYELVGSQNRIGVERGRFEASVARLEAAERLPLAGWFAKAR